MELALNLEWMALVMAMCWLWAHYSRREGQRRSAQVVSLALVLGIMFVVITMYDDMSMARNPAEARCFQRDDDLGAHAQTPLHPDAVSTPMVAAEPSSNTTGLAMPGMLLALAVQVPVLSSIQNRPPPTA